eukprot:TRINITY_DN1048_c1_g1_i1.p1 TRINITY_DN1048_c1_g1~~TRINITY_DN1048_c1_g1_i1.p1  ORF type:complete len:363 (+),score=66.79 TRINITY_DN1048_c1_g1_i1:68-1090(+)
MHKAVTLLLATGAAALTDIQNARIDPITEFTVDDVNVTFSLMMNCRYAQGTDCWYGTFAGAAFRTDDVGVFNRAFFEDAYVKAYNSLSWKVHRADYLTAPRDATNAAAATYKHDVIDNTNRRQHIKWVRVVEKNSPYSVPTVEYGLGEERFTINQPNYWNVFIRINAINVPRKVADNFKEIITSLQTEYDYRANFLTESWWDSHNSAAFITDRLEPVEGRGRKDQALIIPLIGGVISMLLIPILLATCAVSHAKTKEKLTKKNARIVSNIEHTSRTYHDYHAQLQVHQETVDAKQEVITAHEQEMQTRDTYELRDEDVDWETKGLVKKQRNGLPYGDNDI